MKRVFFNELETTLNSCSELFCFGAGKQLKDTIRFLETRNVLHKLHYCVDNNFSKCGSTVEIDNKVIQVISIERFINIIDKNSFLFITCARFLEVIDQLEKHNPLDDLTYIAFESVKAFIHELRAQQIEIPSNIKQSSKPLIPKIIHYCWFGKNQIPDKYKKWMETWHKYCPDYKIVEWNESNYDVSKNLYMKQAYENKKWGFVPDYARLDIIYHYGGVYLDTDVEIISNFDDMLFQEGFAGFESDEHVALGLGFGAVKHNKTIKFLLDKYQDYSFYNADGSLNLTPSPIYQTNALLEKGLVLNGQYQILDNFTIFPEKTFAAKSVSTRQINITSFTKSIHHFDASWKTTEELDSLNLWEQYMKEEK